MKTVGIFGKEKHPDVIQVASVLAQKAQDAGWQVLIEASLGPDLGFGSSLESNQVAAQADLVVVLGGDGTMIRAIRLLDDNQVPVFGVNLGFLGYLTDFTVEEAAGQFAKVLEGDFETIGRVRLKADLL
ncbi:MAG: NAD(+)/NADH kinase, partial [Deltaproteobacteria bacterium]|nr:NAD(+)/NADH kinase [Deltaproteobacteria bacterium]